MIAFFDIDIECITHYSFKTWRAYVHMTFILFKKKKCAVL